MRREITFRTLNIYVKKHKEFYTVHRRKEETNKTIKERRKKTSGAISIIPICKEGLATFYPQTRVSIV